MRGYHRGRASSRTTGKAKSPMRSPALAVAAKWVKPQSMSFSLPELLRSPSSFSRASTRFNSWLPLKGIEATVVTLRVILHA